MPERVIPNPYEGNILVERLPPIRSRTEILKLLTCRPEIPQGVGDIPREVRLHIMRQMISLHIPALEEARLYESIDLAIRAGYGMRDLRRPATWTRVAGETWRQPKSLSTGLAVFVEGPSGTGKSQAIERSFCLLPSIIHHDVFPMCEGGLNQIVSLSMNAPGSGQTTGLATEFMFAWDQMLGTDRFGDILSRPSRRDKANFTGCIQIAVAAFLGILHIDDVEALFRIPPLKQRKGSRTNPADRQLLVVEDKCLKTIANFINTRRIPLLCSGTNDGAAMLRRRLSNAERLSTLGYHSFAPFVSENDPHFITFMDELGRYQYVRTTIAVEPQLLELVFKLTAGIRRIIISLWMFAHRVAFERTTCDELRLEDFIVAAQTYLAPVAAAVQALLSKDPESLSRYEDLVPRVDGSWLSLWPG